MHLISSGTVEQYVNCGSSLRGSSSSITISSMLALDNNLFVIVQIWCVSDMGL